ncbi:hypothetical protein CA13_27530 [Planctomycetes bacterium CA13]|uniref:Uncharacterized protein n=1 Tax=Novipirellula herctigrandis TaxID=2527986 RepID=A0A5C5Z1P0_9BACT|nr:hypothetical protein CA13_27530 [Planctomycetes bacterium CA13]
MAASAPLGASHYWFLTAERLQQLAVGRAAHPRRSTILGGELRALIRFRSSRPRGLLSLGLSQNRTCGTHIRLFKSIVSDLWTHRDLLG